MNQSPLLWIVVVLIVLIAIGAAFWLMRRRSAGAPWPALRGAHLVIGGDGETAAALAAAERGAGRPVLLWGEPAGGVSVVAVGADPAASAARLGLAQARAVLLLGDDDAHNLALADAVVAAAQDRPAGDPLPVIARVDDLERRRAAEGQIATAPAAGTRLRLVSLADLAARTLFTGAPLDRFRRLDQAARPVFMFGFSPRQERYLLRMLAGAHFREGGKPKFVIFTADAAAREAAFRGRRPGADSLAPVVFQTADPADPAAAAALVEAASAAHGAPVAVIVDPGSAAAARAVAEAIAAHFRTADLPTPPIHVHADLPDDAVGTALYPFGGGRIDDIEPVLQERHDALARSAHDFYLEGRLADGEVIGSRISLREWDDLPESVRDDNRLLADCYQNKLRDLGARVAPGSGGGLRLDEAEVEELSRAEHDRWMAAKLIDGWVHGDKRDDAAKHHPDIIPYDALAERIKELDREQIRVMAQLLQRAGQVPRRVLTVALVPATGGAAGEQALADRLTALATDYPDRVLVPTGAIAAPGVRRALVAAQAAGHRVAIVETGNADALIAGLPAAEQAAARQLVRGADTIFAGGAAPADGISLAIAPDGQVA